MATIVANYAAKKLLGKQMEKYKSKKPAGDDDPFFTTLPDRNGKPRKVKKQIPEYIPEHDSHVLSKAKRRAYHLDMSLFTIAGIRFGWSSVIGLIPAMGDVIDLYFAVMLVRLCMTCEGGLPADISSKMWFNVAVDFALGLVPILGDLADATFRCNTRNVALLERYLKEKHGPRDVKARDHSGLEAFPESAGQIPALDGMGDHAGHNQYGTTAPTGGMQQPYVQQQQRQQNTQQNTGSKGWFGFGGGKQQQQDLEHGGQHQQQQTGTVRIGQQS